MNAMLVGKYPKQNNQRNCHWWLLPWQRRHRKVQGQKTTTFDRKGIEKAQQSFQRLTDQAFFYY